jgi:hypothetical protein
LFKREHDIGSGTEWEMSRNSEFAVFWDSGKKHYREIKKEKVHGEMEKKIYFSNFDQN